MEVFQRTIHLLCKGSSESVYSYGHRNPQGMTIHPKTGEIWENEHGPKGGDESILFKREKTMVGQLSYGINYSGTSITDKIHARNEQPFYYWVPSIAPSGMAFSNPMFTKVER